MTIENVTPENFAAALGPNVKYFIVGERTIATLIDKVNSAILAGWRPKGGIAPMAYTDASGNQSFAYYQAISRD